MVHYKILSHDTYILKFASFQSNPICSVFFFLRKSLILSILLKQFLSNFQQFSQSISFCCWLHSGSMKPPAEVSEAQDIDFPPRNSSCPHVTAYLYGEHFQKALLGLLQQALVLLEVADLLP